MSNPKTSVSRQVTQRMSTSATPTMVFSRKDLKIRIRKPIAKNRLEVFSKNISWEVNHVHAHEVLSNCEVDQELEYVFHLSSYKVIIWVQDGLITIPTTLIIICCNVVLVMSVFKP